MDKSKFHRQIKTCWSVLMKNRMNVSYKYGYTMQTAPLETEYNYTTFPTHLAEHFTYKSVTSQRAA